MLYVLAQDAGSSIGDVLWWSVVLLLALGVLVLVGLWLVRWLGREEEPEHGDAGLTLADLREMHRDGKLTDEEFEKAKAAIIERSRAMLDEPTPEHVGDAGVVLHRDAAAGLHAAVDHPTPTPDAGTDLADPPHGIAKGEEPIPDPTQGGRRPDLNHPGS